VIPADCAVARVGALALDQALGDGAHALRFTLRVAVRGSSAS
jgi:hypothetical protein